MGQELDRAKQELSATTNAISNNVADWGKMTQSEFFFGLDKYLQEKIPNYTFGASEFVNTMISCIMIIGGRKEESIIHPQHPVSDLVGELESIAWLRQYVANTRQEYAQSTHLFPADQAAITASCNAINEVLTRLENGLQQGKLDDSKTFSGEFTVEKPSVYTENAHPESIWQRLRPDTAKFVDKIEFNNSSFLAK